MKYSEAIKLIKGLSNKYSIYNNYKSVFELSYEYKSVAWVDKQERFNFGRVNIVASEFNKLPYSHKLWMILSELAMTQISEREKHKWNVIIGNDSSGFDGTVCWGKKDSNSTYLLCLADSIHLANDEVAFTDDEFNDLIKYIKTLPDGEWQAKVAEHGKTLIKED